jgi:hypothetical protein
MEEVLGLIEKKKQELAKSGLFEFMRDQSIDPRQRLAFAPCMAPLVMSFAECNKYVFPEQPTNHPLQVIVNKHSYEEGDHWLWFQEDLQTLGINKSLKFSDALNFVWSEETKASRWVSHQIFRYACGASPSVKLLVLEVIEAVSNVFFSTTQPIAEELRTITQKELIYFGHFHFEVENNHSKDLPQQRRWSETIQLTIESRQEAFEVVENLFKAFTEMMDELLVYAKTHSFDQPLVKPRDISQPLKAA